MVDSTHRDLINAEQNIKGALKERKLKFERDNKYNHVMGTGTYNISGLYTIITIIAATITLFFAVLVSRYFLLLLPEIFAIDWFIESRRKNGIEEMNIKLLNAWEEREETDLNAIFE